MISKSRHTLLIFFRPFTQVVTETQFSTLGLVLIAELARLRKIIGTEAHKIDRGFELASKGYHLVPSNVTSSLIEDLGEAIERRPSGDRYTKQIQAHQIAAGALVASSGTNGTTSKDIKFVNIDGKIALCEGKSSVTSRPKPAKSKKSKAGNIIDDLFSALT